MAAVRIIDLFCSVAEAGEKKFCQSFWNVVLKKLISDQQNTWFERHGIKVEEKKPGITKWKNKVWQLFFPDLVFKGKDVHWGQNPLSTRRDLSQSPSFTKDVLYLQPKVTWNKMFSSSPAVTILLFIATVQMLSSWAEQSMYLSEFSAWYNLWLRQSTIRFELGGKGQWSHLHCIRSHWKNWFQPHSPECAGWAAAALEQGRGGSFLLGKGGLEPLLLNLTHVHKVLLWSKIAFFKQ